MTFGSEGTWSFASRCCGFSALVVWIGHFYFWFLYLGAGPRRPDYPTGQFIPLNNHGDVHYITQSQDHTITVLETLAFALFAVGFLIQGLIVRPPKPKPWEKQMY
jgi:hypothetical protein